MNIEYTFFLRAPFQTPDRNEQNVRQFDMQPNRQTDKCIFKDIQIYRQTRIEGFKERPIQILDITDNKWIAQMY